MENQLNPNQTRPSDIGREKRCSSCGEFWPADKEFFALAVSSSDQLSKRCLACIRERVWAFVPLNDG